MRQCVDYTDENKHNVIDTSFFSDVVMELGSHQVKNQIPRRLALQQYLSYQCQCQR